MQKVTVFYFEFLDKNNDKKCRSSWRAKFETILLLDGSPLPETALYVEESRLDINGVLVIRRSEDVELDNLDA